MMIRPLILFLLILFSFQGGPALAAGNITTSWAFNSGNWKGLNFYRDGRFSHCQMSAMYRNGNKLIFGLEPNKAMSVGVINRAWNLVPGRKEEVRLLVDGRTALWTTAKVLRPQHIAAFFRTDSSTYNMLRRGDILTIEAGGKRLSFRLQGTSQALVRLLGCTIAGIKSNRYMADAAPPVNRGSGIFAPAPAPAPAPAEPRMAARPAPANPFAAPAPAKRNNPRRTPFSYGEWQGGSYLSKRTGKFSHCAMSAGYKSGSRLVFAILRDKTMSIGVTHPKWQMNVGSQLPLDFSVDGRHAVTAKAKVINPRQYASYFQSNAEIFEMIRNGRVLQIGSSGSTQKFSLTGINQSLVKLLACTVNALKAEETAAAAPANPFSGSSSPRPPANPFSGSGASAAPSNPFTSPAARQPARPATPKPLFGKERDA